LMQCVFDQELNTPAWWKAAKAQARALAKAVEKAILPIFDERGRLTWTFSKITSLDDVMLINHGELGRVKRSGVTSLEELADLAPQELMMKGRMPFERALQILERLREMIWN
jgi:hypothetical protein